MNRIIVTCTVLILLLAGNGWPQGIQELKYDDGVANLTWTFGTHGRFFTTRFSLESSVLLEKARFFIVDTLGGATFNFAVYLDSNGEPGYPLVDQVPMRVERLGWNEIDLTEYELTLSEEFYLSIEYDLQSQLSIGAEDQDPLSRRSYDSDC